MAEPITIEDQNFTSVVVDGKDSYSKAFGQNDRPVTVRRSTIGAAQAEWGLKHSLVFEAIYEDCVIQGGIERAFDQVRGGKVTFLRCKFVNLGRPRVTSRWDLQKESDIGLKAGVRDAVFIDCEMNDLLLGDYSIYDQVNRPPTRRISLTRCKNPNGGPIFVRGRHCAKDTLTFTNTEVSMLVWPGLVTKAYFAFNRRFGDRRVVIPDQFILRPEESDT